MTLLWGRPGMAKKLHAYAPTGAALCGSWLRPAPAAPVREAVTREEACRECWNKAQAKKYRPAVQ